MREDPNHDFSNNSLQTLPKLSNSVKFLTADNNQITSLTTLPSCLEYLSLVKNKIAFLGNLESQGQNLQYLDLSFNRLISLEGLGACHSLQVLKLSNNYVGDDQILHLQGLTGLKVLDVSHNHLRDKRFLQVLASLQGLEELYNSSNDFSEWKVQSALRSLKKMVLDSNKIRKLEFFNDLPSLNLLSCRENNVLAVVGISFCPALNELDLSANDLNEISDEFSQLDMLKKVNFRNNSLTTLPKIRNLEVIDVSHNTLLSILSLGLRVRELNASHNSISQIPDLPYLLFGDFSYNRLTGISGLDDNEGLVSINLAHNLLTSPSAVLKSLQKNAGLKNFNIEGLDLPSNFIDLVFETFPEIEHFNGQVVNSSNSKKARLSSACAWDNLSKSKLFPSCRSSLAEIDKNIYKNPSAEISIFSDYKSGGSLASSINSKKNHESRYLAQDSEYELLAKELDINKRIRCLEQKTRHLGDSLISRKSNSEGKVEALSSFAYVDKNLNDSLISVKSTRDEETVLKVGKKAENLRKTRNNSESNSEKRAEHYEILPFSQKTLENIKTRQESNQKILKTPEAVKQMVKINTSVIQNPSSISRSAITPSKASLNLCRVLEKSSSDLITCKPSPNPGYKPLFPQSSEQPSKPVETNPKGDPSKIVEKEDSTISFEISNDVSKSREPAKFISDSSRKSKCCKHCCRKRKRSANVQTTLKNQEFKLIDQAKFIDQATSPMNSLIRLSPIKSSRPGSENQDDVLKLDYEKCPTPISNRSFMTDVPSSNRNKSFIDDKEVRPLSYKRSSTPLLSNRNLPPRPKEPESVQLLNYASTPPRPILASEANSPVLCSLNPKGSEFFLVSQLFTGEGKKVAEVIKTYTFFLQKNLNIGRSESFLGKSSENKNFFVFFKANPEDMEIICNSPDGFRTFVDPGKEDLLVFKEFKEVDADGCVLVALASGRGMNLVKNNIFRLTRESLIIPVYLVQFCN